MTNTFMTKTLKNSNTLRPMEQISCYFIFKHLDCIKCSEINMNYCYAHKNVTTRIWYENICDCGWKLMKVHFMLFYTIFK